MKQLKGTALLMVWANVPIEMEDDYNRWYNEEHIEERLSCPGFLSAGRYEAVSSGPKHLAVYELDNIGALQTKEYQHFKNFPSELSQHVLAGITIIRNSYEMIFPLDLSEDVASSEMAPALQIGRMEVSPQEDAEWNEWYNSVYVPNYMKVPGCIRGRRYKGGSLTPGQPKYSTVYELTDPEISKTDEWLRQRAIDPRNTKWQNAMNHAPGSPGVWIRTY